jgi:hypothetical protein
MDWKTCDTFYDLYHVQLIVTAVRKGPVRKWKFNFLDVEMLQAVAEDRVASFFFVFRLQLSHCITAASRCNLRV